MRVAGGAIAKKVLSSLGVKVRGGVVQVGDIKAKDINYETKNEFNFLDESKVEGLKAVSYTHLTLPTKVTV